MTDAAQPREEPATMNRLLLAVEEVDNAWHDDEGTVRYTDEFFDRIVALRRAYGDYEAAAHATESRPDRPPIVFCHDPACDRQRFGAHPFHATERPDPLTAWERSDLSRHTEDGNGGCIVCREWTGEFDEDGEMCVTIMSWPCAKVRLAATERPRTEPLDVRQAIEEISGELSHYDLSDDPGYIKVPTERVRAILRARLSPPTATPTKERA